MEAFAAKIVTALSFPVLCVTFDVPNHGERLVAGCSSFNTAWRAGNLTHAMDMYAKLIEIHLTISLLIDFLPLKTKVQAFNHAVMGISLGGHAVLMCLTHEPRLAVGVSYISSGDYRLNMETRYERLEAYYAREAAKDKSTDLSLKELPTWEDLFPSDLLSLVQKYDPIENVEKFLFATQGVKMEEDPSSVTIRPVLIVNGGADKLVPKQCNINFVQKVRKAVLASAKGDTQVSENELQKLKHVILPNVKHEVTEEMEEMGVHWLEMHLMKTDVVPSKPRSSSKI